MSHALRNDVPTSPLRQIGVAKATSRRPRTGAQLRAAFSRHPQEDFGLVCHDCSTVTIFSSGAAHPLCCSRCGHALRASLVG